MSLSGKQLGHSANNLLHDRRVLMAERGGVLVAVLLPNIGRALPVRCSARLPMSVSWCAGRAVAEEFDVWLLDVSPSSPTRSPDHALLAPGEVPTWALRVDRVIGLATVVSVLAEDVSSWPLSPLASWPKGWPAGWATTCTLDDGRQAGLLASHAISRELAGVAA